jgi:hypothetical protein
MKKTLLLSLVTMGWLVQSASAQSLFTTTNDFGQFNSGAGVVSSSYYSLNSTLNGVGNTSNPGGTGGIGSLQLTSANGYGFMSGGSISGPTAGAFTALSPGSTRPYSPESGYGSGNMLAGSGTFMFDVYTANLIGYSYYNFGIGLNYNGNYDFFFANSSSTFTGADGNTWTQYVVPYTTEAAALTYFQWGVVENSGGGPGGETIYVDNFQVQAAPEPGTMALAVAGGVAFLFIRRRSVR